MKTVGKIVCHWKEGSDVCYIGKRYHPLQVVAKTHKKKITEPESLGGGWYGANESRIEDITEWLAYYDGKLIGEISLYNVMFQKPDTWHLLLKTIELPLIQISKP